MATSTLRSAFVCQSCRHVLRNAEHASSASRLALAQTRWASQSTWSYQQTPSGRAKRPELSQRSCVLSRRQQSTVTSSARSLQGQDLSQLHARIDQLSTRLLQAPGVPSEDAVLEALREFESIAHELSASKDRPSMTTQAAADSTATSSLLSSVNKGQASKTITKADLFSLISTRALSILQHPPVFITSTVLKTYISVQSLLANPSSFPDVLYAYRTKPVPRPSSTQAITYTTPNSSKVSAAVPPAIADAALDAAIKSHDLPLALAVLDNTYCTTAYKRSKFLRSALFPFAGLALTPPAAYTLATRFSDMQNTMDSGTATGVAMAGILTYTSAVAVVGYVALTTANDQMVRVTWATGMPLWERWTREEERAASDRIAQAWGFKSVDRWGEEEGFEWESLKEWTGLRGMVLDRVELMEGME